jgi:hypothetical protein
MVFPGKISQVPQDKLCYNHITLGPRLPTGKVFRRADSGRELKATPVMVFPLKNRDSFAPGVPE